MNVATAIRNSPVVRKLARQVRLMVARAIVELVNDDGTVQVSGLASEVLDQVELFQSYGLHVRPLPPDASGAARGVLLSVAGSRDHPVLVNAGDRRHEPATLEPGEVMLYDDQGCFVHLKRGGEIDVTAPTKITATAPECVVKATTKVTLDSPLTLCTGVLQATGLGIGVAPAAGKAKVAGDVEATGNVADAARSMADDRALYNQHTHEDLGAETGPPTPTQ